MESGWVPESPASPPLWLQLTLRVSPCVELRVSDAVPDTPKPRPHLGDAVLRLVDCGGGGVSGRLVVHQWE